MNTIMNIAGYMANRSDWQFSNLQLQKLVYLCQLFHLGHAEGKPLFHENFEAWDYGPVVPNLYHKLKMFGAEDVQIYSGLPIDADLSGMEAEIVKQIVVIGLESRPGRLVSLTHMPGGAWARNYELGKNNIISKSDICAEYKLLGKKKQLEQQQQRASA